MLEMKIEETNIRELCLNDKKYEPLMDRFLKEPYVGNPYGTGTTTCTIGGNPAADDY